MSSLVPHVSEELKSARAQLVELRATLADREVELAELRARLRAFEAKYMREVGVLYAALDEWEAKIAEREVDLYNSEEARKRAEEQRAQAEATKKAAYADELENVAEEFEPPVSLKQLFREVAKRIHPDFARDEAELAHFTLLMARANEAYTRGDADLLQRMLDDHHEINAGIQGEGAVVELARISRQIQHARRDIANLEAEQSTLLASEIAQLLEDAEAAKREHRDLLTELATNLKEQVAEAQRRFELIDRQIRAHGR